MGKNLRYILVAKYAVPKQYLAMYTGKEPPPDDGIDAALKDKTSKEEEKLLEDFFGKDDLKDGDGSDLKGVEVKFIPEDPSVINPEEYEELDIEDTEPSKEDKDPGEPDTDPVDEGMAHADCVGPDLTFLTFGVGLPNNQSSTVKKGLQDIVLYLQAHGLPVYRFHADKGEFYNHMLRSWMRDQGIYATWAEPSVPQTNGGAESTVRWVKDRARTATSILIAYETVACGSSNSYRRAEVQSPVMEEFTSSPVWCTSLSQKEGLRQGWSTATRAGAGT